MGKKIGQRAKGTKTENKPADVQPKVTEHEVESEEEEDIGEIDAAMGDDQDSDTGEDSSSEDISESEEETSNSEGEEDENEENNDDDQNDQLTEDELEDKIPKKKKRKVDEDGSQAFTNAFSSIMGSKLKAYKRKAPIMARNKTVQKQLESEKLELKAKRELLSERKQLHDRHRVKNLLPTGETENVRQILEHEKHLKKLAQKGVVRLFNAVLASQVRSTQAVSKEQAGQVKKQELFNEMSKEKFLDLVQSAGKS